MKSPIPAILDRLVVYCADVGSVRNGNFAWARGVPATSKLTSDQDIRQLVRAVAGDLNNGAPVALGFECPLFVPVRDRVDELASKREGEGARPWSAGAGAAALATGLVQTRWVLQEIRGSVSPATRAFVDWHQFFGAGRGLFLWEAFVTARAKGNDHATDARTGVQCFLKTLPDPTGANAIPEKRVLSLLGAALVRTGWSKDRKLLKTPCVVIKASERGERGGRIARPRKVS